MTRGNTTNDFDSNFESGRENCVLRFSHQENPASRDLSTTFQEQTVHRCYARIVVRFVLHTTDSIRHVGHIDRGNGHPSQ